jgi:tRNA pseudouridine55 synthase
VVAKVRSLLGTQKVGHTGTLDPDATGVLPVCVGKATKLSQYLLASEKEYRVVLKLGETTDTQDGSGRRTGGSGRVDLDEASVRAALSRFVGKGTQIPPMYSAVKQGGVPLYRLARRGEVVAREPREVEIREIRFLGMAGDRVTFEMVCSKGTYVRVLCADVGEALSVGGHLETLVRLRTGPFTLGETLTLEELESLVRNGGLSERLISPDRMVEGLPRIRLRPPWVRRVQCGAPVEADAVLMVERSFVSGDRVRLSDDEGRLIGIGVALCDQSEAVPPLRGTTIVKIDRILL